MSSPGQGKPEGSPDLPRGVSLPDPRASTNSDEGDDDDEEEESEEEEEQKLPGHNRQLSEQPVESLPVNWSGAVPSLLRTSFALPDGTVLFVDGSRRTKDGFITSATDPGLEDALDYLDSSGIVGAVKFLDGCFLLRDGAVLLPSHSIVSSSNSILRWDGKILTPKWRLAFGSRPLPTGALFSPSGTIQYPDGTSQQCVRREDGKYEVKSSKQGAFADGSWIDETGSLVFPSGSKVTSGTWVRLPAGQQRATLWHVPLWHVPTQGTIPRFELPEVIGSDSDPVFDLRSFDLMSAAQSCDARMVERFLKGGVGDPDEKDAHGNTAMHLTWSLPCFQYLIQFGGSPDLLNDNGQQAGAKFVFAHRAALQAFELKLQGSEMEKGLHEIMLTINIHCKDFPKPPKGHNVAVVVSGRAPGEADYLHVAETELVRHKGDVTFRQDVVMEYRPGVSLRFEAYSCPVELKRLQKELCKLIGVGEIDSDQLFQSSRLNKFNIVQVRNPLDSALNKALQLQSASIRLRATHTNESVEEASSAAVESTWIEATLFCTDVKGFSGFVAAVSADDEGTVATGNTSPNKRFKYLGRTEYIASDELNQSARFTHKVMFQHRIPDDNHRVLRFGLYSDPSIATPYLIGQAVVSMTHLLANHQVEADNNTFRLLTRRGVETGARLGVVMQVVTESARTKRYLPPDLEFSLKCIMPPACLPKGSWLIEAWSRANETDREYVGAVGCVNHDGGRSLEFPHSLCVKNVDLAQSLQLCLRRDIDDHSNNNNESNSGVSSNSSSSSSSSSGSSNSNNLNTTTTTKNNNDNIAIDGSTSLRNTPRNGIASVSSEPAPTTTVEEIYECDFVIADVRMLQFSPKPVTFKFPFALSKVMTDQSVTDRSDRPEKEAKTIELGTMCLTAQMCGTLEVAVACTKLPRIHGPFSNTKCNPFVAVYLKGKKLSQTELVRNEPNPFFKRRLRLPLTSEQVSTDLEFVVHYVTEAAGRAPVVEVMGSVKLPSLRAIIAHEYDPFFSYQIVTKTKTEEAPTLDLRATFVTAFSEDVKEGLDAIPPISGWLNKTRRGGLTKNWRKRYFVLQDGVLKYYENETATEVLGHFSVSQATVRRYDDLFGSPNAFSVALPDQTRMYYLQASFARERDMWVLCLARHGALTSRQAELHVEQKGLSLPRHSTELSSPLSEPPPSPSSSPVSSTAGYLGKTRRGGLLKHWKKRYFTLDGGTMSYFQDKDSVSGQALGSFSVKGCALQKPTELFGSSLTFTITSNGRPYHLQASAAKERDGWIQCLLANGAIYEEPPQSPKSTHHSLSTPRPSVNTSPTKE